MRNHHPEYGIIKKEWVAKRWILITLALVQLLLMAFLIGQPVPVSSPPVCFSVVGFMILGITFFSRDEYDPARAFIYQLPISRRRLLLLKLRALAFQIAILLLLLLAWIAMLSIASTFARDSDHFHRITSLMERDMVMVLLTAASSLALALLAAIVSLHIRSVIVALLLTPVLAAPAALLIEWPQLISNSLTVNQHMASDAQRFLSLPDLGWIALKLAIVTLLLGGWLFFVFCKTRLRELNPTPRALLVFLFGIAAVEVIFTIFYTGWRDLAWLVFGI